jgi:hypothetical protein
MAKDRKSTTADLQLDASERTRCEVWTRVMGYYRPVSMWNAGKQSEYADRRAFVEPSSAHRTPFGQQKLGL